MLQFLSKGMLYTLLMFASPAVNAMRVVDTAPRISVFESEATGRRRHRQLERRFGSGAALSSVRFVS